MVLTISVSETVMSRFGRGEPSNWFSGMVTWYSLLSNFGGSSFTSRIVIETSAVTLVPSSLDATPLITSRACYERAIIMHKVYVQRRLSHIATLTYPDSKREHTISIGEFFAIQRFRGTQFASISIQKKIIVRICNKSELTRYIMNDMKSQLFAF